VVREALSFAEVVAAGAAAIAQTLVLGLPMAPVERTMGLPSDAQKRLIEYRQREATFKSQLKPSPGASEGERELYERRVGIERVIVSLFPRGDSARIAAGYALDADFERGARFIDGLLRDLPVRWLAPYLNLVAGHEKQCAGERDAARRQLAAARDGGHPLIRVAAEELIASGQCFSP
jgi:hypothetical protein